MALDNIFKRAREKAKTSDSATGAKVLGTSLKNAESSRTLATPSISRIGASAPKLQFEEPVEVGTEKNESFLDRLKTELKSVASGMNGLQDYEVKDEFTGITTKQLGRLSLDKINYSKADDVNSDTFLGQFASNYGVGRLSQTQGLAWNAYLDDPTESNKKAAQEIDALLADYSKRNATALDEQGRKLAVVSQSLANYLPQFQDQIGATVKGGIAAGIASAGNPTAIKV